MDFLKYRLQSLNPQILKILQDTAEMPKLSEHFFFKEVMFSLLDFCIENYDPSPIKKSFNENDFIIFKINQL
jgi:hypothetical protein